jgi:hypothetical protein
LCAHVDNQRSQAVLHEAESNMYMLKLTRGRGDIWELLL